MANEGEEKPLLDRQPGSFDFHLLRKVSEESNRLGIPKQWRGPTNRSKTKEVMEQVEEVKGIMQNNIENLVRNVDNLEVIQDKTDNMRQTSSMFKKNATGLRRQMWCRNMKLNIIIALVVLAILAAIVLFVVLPLVLS